MTMRASTQTTALVVRYGGKPIAIWRDGRKHTGGNLAERALRKVVLLKMNSLFFKNERAAAAGDILMSPIQACRLHSVDACSYLLTLIREEVVAVQYPNRDLPWN